MKQKEYFVSFWRDVAAQDAAALRAYFAPDAQVLWHNTNERFTVDEYITANCEYPGDWRGGVERVETAQDAAVTVARVWPAAGGASFHAVSFFTFTGGRISLLEEYWGDDGPAPQWRLEKHIGAPIRPGL